MKKLVILLALLIPFTSFAGQKTKFNWTLTIMYEGEEPQVEKVDPDGKDSFFLKSSWKCGYHEIQKSFKKPHYLEISGLRCFKTGKTNTSVGAFIMYASCGKHQKTKEIISKPALMLLMDLNLVNQTARNVTVELRCR